MGIFGEADATLSRTRSAAYSGASSARVLDRVGPLATLAAVDEWQGVSYPRMDYGPPSGDGRMVNRARYMPWSIKEAYRGQIGCAQIPGVKFRLQNRARFAYKKPCDARNAHRMAVLITALRWIVERVHYAWRSRQRRWLVVMVFDDERDTARAPVDWSTEWFELQGLLRSIRAASLSH